MRTYTQWWVDEIEVEVEDCIGDFEFRSWSLARRKRWAKSVLDFIETEALQVQPEIVAVLADIVRRGCLS